MEGQERETPDMTQTARGKKALTSAYITYEPRAVAFLAKGDGEKKEAVAYRC